MKKKTGLFSLGILTILLFVSFTSAIAFTDSVSSIVLTPQDSSQTFTLISDGNATFDLTPTVFDLTDGTTIVTISINADLTNSNNVEYTVEASGLLNEFDFGKVDTSNVVASIVNDTNSSDTDSKAISITFENEDFCEGLASNGLRINIEDVSVINGFGDDEDYWYLYDEIEVEVEVDNRANEDLEDLEIYWELYTTAGFEISSGDVSRFDLNENDKETITFTFKLDRDVEEFDGEDAVLYVGVRGEGDDTKDDYCAYENALEVSVETRDDFVIAGNFMVNDQEIEEITSLSCGQRVRVNAEIFNLGDNNQDDVYVKVYSSGLGINERFDFNEIDAFDNEMIEFEFDVPKDMENKFYILYFEVYDEDNDIFENGEDDKSKRAITFEGEENCEIDAPTITAELLGEAKAGKAIVIDVILTNNDERNQMFLVEVEGYNSWATLNEIRPKLFELEPGESKQVEIVLTANRDIESGDYEFDVVASTEGERIMTQAVAVSVEGRNFNFDFSPSFENFDWKLWGIVALNIILLLAIIIVTVKILRKK